MDITTVLEAWQALYGHVELTQTLLWTIRNCTDEGLGGSPEIYCEAPTILEVAEIAGQWIADLILPETPRCSCIGAPGVRTTGLHFLVGYGWEMVECPACGEYTNYCYSRRFE